MSTRQCCGNDGKYLHTTPLVGCLDHLATGCVKDLSNTWPFHEHRAGGRNGSHHSLHHGEQERPSPIMSLWLMPRGSLGHLQPRKVASTPGVSELSVHDSQVPAEGLFGSQVLQMRFHEASQQNEQNDCRRWLGILRANQFSCLSRQQSLSLSNTAQALRLSQGRMGA